MSVVHHLDAVAVELREYGAVAFQQGREDEVPVVASAIKRINGLKDELSHLLAGNPLIVAEPNPPKAQVTVYEVDGNRLAKTGPSKSGTYTHRVPREVYLQIVGLMASKRQDFNLSDIISETHRPDYYTYIVAGLLRSREAIEEVARGRYRVISDDLRVRAERLWHDMAGGNKVVVEGE